MEPGPAGAGEPIDRPLGLEDTRGRAPDSPPHTGQFLHFNVRDTGIGIPPDQHHNLFQVFSQVDGLFAQTLNGTGLGLAICRQLVELMGGRIGVDSEPGRGSTFWFLLPLDHAVSPVAKETLQPGPDGKTARVERGSAYEIPSVLVVEDNPVNQDVAVGMLGKLGYRADIAANGQEALDALSQKAYALVFMDCQLPDMSGLRVTAQIRRREQERQARIIAADTTQAGAFPKETESEAQGDACREMGPGRTSPEITDAAARIPIVGMTAYALPGQREKCLQAGMDDCLAKPVSLQAVQGVLRRWLRDTTNWMADRPEPEPRGPSESSHPTPDCR